MNRSSRIAFQLERPALFLILMLDSGSGLGIVTPSGPGSAPAGLDAAVGRVAHLSLFMFFIWAISRLRGSFDLILRERWIAVLVIWSVASIGWSVQPGQTLRYSMALAVAMLVGLYIGIRIEPLQQIRLVALCLGITAILSLSLGLFAPKFAISPDGEWRGAFLHKNSLSYLMSLSALCFLFLAICERRRRWFFVTMALLSCVLVVLSKSAGGLVVTLIMFVLLTPLYKILQLSKRGFIAAIVASAAVFGVGLALVLQNLTPLFNLLGRDATFTGRVQLWQHVKQEILTRPVLGFGYSAFWSTGEADRLRAAVGWEPWTAHNGFLDAALGLGFLGLIILCIGLLRNFILGIGVARQKHDLTLAWPLFFMIFAVLSNLMESWITGASACCKPPLQIGASSLFWTLYIANSYWLVRISSEVEQPTLQERTDISLEFLGLESSQS